MTLQAMQILVATTTKIVTTITKAATTTIRASRARCSRDKHLVKCD